MVNSCCWRCVNYETSQMGYCRCCRACRGLIFDEQVPPTRKFQLGFRQQIATKEFWDSLSVRILKVALSTTTFWALSKIFPNRQFAHFFKTMILPQQTTISLISILIVSQGGYLWIQILLHSTFVGKLFLCIPFFGIQFFSGTTFSAIPNAIFGIQKFLSTKI